MLFLLLILCEANSCTRSSRFDADAEAYGKRCDSLRQRAEADYRGGKRIYWRDGTIELDEFEMFYSKYMEEKYGISPGASCVIDEFHMCYNWAMNDEIESEFGDSIMEISYREAKVLFAHSGQGDSTSAPQ